MLYAYSRHYRAGPAAAALSIPWKGLVCCGHDMHGTLRAPSSFLCIECRLLALRGDRVVFREQPRWKPGQPLTRFRGHPWQQPRQGWGRLVCAWSPAAPAPSLGP